MPYRIRITSEELRHLDRLPQKVLGAVLETIYGSIASNPHGAGKPLRRELEGVYSARRGDYRVIYEIDEGAHVVVVHRAQHRGRIPRRR